MADCKLFPQDVIDNVQSIIDQPIDNMGVITKWNTILEVLKDHVYVLEDVSPKYFLVHPDNRSKLGVNPYNAHRTGAYIKKVGADLVLLKKATAFEISPMIPMKMKQFEFNRKLVQNSCGLLAPVSGTERFVSVSCGHTVQFCKAALAGCVTPQTSLADATGRLNVQAISNGDKAFQVMLEKGWSWTVVPWPVEATWPSLPDLAQRALNASNSVASQSSELEVAASIAEFAALEQAGSGSIDWGRCGLAAVAGLPPCTGYVTTLVEYVRLYGGGPGAPMVVYLDEFSKRYGENKRLGEDFIKGVAETVFSASRRVPHLRTAFLAANLVSPKVVDGVAKLLVKSDVEKLKSKDLAATVDDSESELAEAWGIAERLWDSNICSREGLYPVIGRFHCRVVLWLTAKGKLGFEGKEYKKLQDIRNVFAQELIAALPAGQSVDHPWFKGPAVVAASSSSSGQSGPVTITQLQDVKWQATDAGWDIDKIYFEKNVGPSAGIYRLKAILPDGIRLEEQSVTKESSLSITVPVDKFGKLWAEFKGLIQSKLEGIGGHMVSESNDLLTGSAKANAFQVLYVAALKHDPKESLCYYINPAEVRTTCKINKGGLTLVPCTTPDKITALKATAVVHVFVATLTGGNTFYLNEPPKLRTMHKEEWRHANVVVPFWWVATTAVETEANMIEKTFTEEMCTFTSLVNSRQLSLGEKLFVYKKRADKTPLMSASSQSAAPPAAKAAPPEPRAKKAPSKMAAAPSKTAAPKSKRPRK